MSKPTAETQIIPYIFYRDVPAALDWLSRAFGFAEELRHATPGGMHAQMTFGEQRIMMGQGSRDWRMQSPGENRVATMGVFIYLADVDAHYERAHAAGAEIVHPRTTKTMAAPTPRAIWTAILGFLLPRPIELPPIANHAPRKSFSRHSRVKREFRAATCGCPPDPRFGGAASPSSSSAIWSAGEFTGFRREAPAGGIGRGARTAPRCCPGRHRRFASSVGSADPAPIRPKSRFRSRQSSRSPRSFIRSL